MKSIIAALALTGLGFSMTIYLPPELDGCLMRSDELYCPEMTAAGEIMTKASPEKIKLYYETMNVSLPDEEQYKLLVIERLEKVTEGLSEEEGAVIQNAIKDAAGNNDEKMKRFLEVKGN